MALSIARVSVFVCVSLVFIFRGSWTAAPHRIAACFRQRLIPSLPISHAPSKAPANAFIPTPATEWKFGKFLFFHPTFPLCPSLFLSLHCRIFGDIFFIRLCQCIEETIKITRIWHKNGRPANDSEMKTKWFLRESRFQCARYAYCTSQIHGYRVTNWSGALLFRYF